RPQRSDSLACCPVRWSVRRTGPDGCTVRRWRTVNDRPETPSPRGAHMASEKAKALAAQQKAAIKAEKLRKKNSDDPRDWGRVRQIIEAYKRTNEIDPQLKWWTVLAVGVPILLSVGLGLWLQPWWLWLITGVMLALVAVLYVLTWRVKKANFTRYEGQA